MTLKEKIADFRKRQFEIVDLEKEIDPKKQLLIQEFKTKVAALEQEYQEKVNEVTKPLDNKIALYRADLKQFAGFTDGEKTNVLDVVEAMANIKEME